MIWLSLVATSALAQDLDPRAYAQAPTGLTVAIAGVGFSSGGVLTDPTVPAQNGATLAFPVGNRHSIEVSWSTGAVIRSGADFTTLSVGWQTGWLDRRRPQTP